MKQGGTADAASNCSFALDRKESVEGFFVALGSIPEGRSASPTQQNRRSGRKGGLK
ncbi:MAG: hypothetical protein J6Y58_00725 [Clostridiales bacterium]|nr:hypothetical protein [Clostridiales bacterium]